MLTDRAWYALATLLASLYFCPADSSVPEPECLRRPFWLPSWVLWLCKQVHLPARVALLVVGLALAASTNLAESQAWRGVFLSLVLVVDAYYYAGYLCHPGFCLLHTCAAMVLPPGASRAGVLHVVVAHQLASPGLAKLRIAGLKGFRDTMRILLHNSKQSHWSAPGNPHQKDSGVHTSLTHFLIEPQWVKQQWLICFMLNHPRLLSLGSYGAVALEISALPLVLLGGPTAMHAYFWAASCFHLGITLTMGIIFPFNIPCYMLALLTDATHDPLDLLNAPTVIVGLALGAASLSLRPEWPCDAMAVFALNPQQSKRLTELYGRFRLGFVDSPATAGPCLTAVTSYSPLPCGVDPLFLDAIGFWRKQEEKLDDQTIRTRLIDWLRQSRPFIEAASFRCYDDVRLVKSEPIR